MPIIRRARLVLLVIVVAVGLTACSSPTSPSSSATDRFGGTWTGTGQVTRIPWQGGMSFPTATLTLVFARQDSEITRAGLTLTGTWTMTSSDPAVGTKSGSLQMRAFMSQDCTGGPQVELCTSSYTTLTINDLLLSSTAACSTFYQGALGFDTGTTTTMSVDVHNGQGGAASDPTCSGSVPNHTYAYLSGSFKVTKQ
jgi:hypothetical protein